MRYKCCFSCHRCTKTKAFINTINLTLTPFPVNKFYAFRCWRHLVVGLSICLCGHACICMKSLWQDISRKDEWVSFKCVERVRFNRTMKWSDCGFLQFRHNCKMVQVNRQGHKKLQGRGSIALDTVVMCFIEFIFGASLWHKLSSFILKVVMHIWNNYKHQPNLS